MSSSTERTTLLHVTTVPMSLTFLRGQVGYMQARGLDVQALSSPGPDLDEFRRAEGVPVHAVEMPRAITPARDLAAVARLLRVLLAIRPAIVHAHTPKGGLLGMVAAALAAVPVRIYHMRGLPFVTATGPNRLLLRQTERLSCRLAHRVICNSNSMQEAAIAEGLCPPEKIVVLAGGSGNGVDAEGRFDPGRLDGGVREVTRTRLGIPPEARVIGFIGRLVRDKGIIELVEAWRRIRARHPHARLLLVGPFEPRDPIPAELRRELEGDARVILAGMDWNTPPLYAAMDLVVLPTYREGFPNVPLEAAAMRLPIVATRVPGCIDAVADGETGLLVPPRDSAALGTAIERYLDHPELARSHAAAGRRRVLKEFRQEIIWAALHAEYLRLLEERQLPQPQVPSTLAADLP
jgi:glycosyltransferase involved in cell wall biosynthesis